ncbi:unnamed protein product [Adineta ricciae]|uniref:Heparan-alpha-glucosaminide N-acetyltransferase-like protein n=1 Tax=Adineta ricciae TaxID=249248 RepID=A0A815LH55_ADIRI|nr:unnamed protein product [Adineta ricciae]
MYKSFRHLWIILCIIQHLLPYAETQITDDWLDPLSMDEAYLTIINRNVSFPIRLQIRSIVCEECDFTVIPESSTYSHVNTTIIVSTTYAQDIEVISEITNETLPCQIKAYKFAEHASYTLELSDDSPLLCTITQTKDGSYYWLPVIIGMGSMLALVVVIQIWKCITQRSCCSRLLLNRFRTTTDRDYTISLPKNPTTIVNDPNDDIISTLSTGSELPLVGSTRLSNNSVRITKVLPKRLRSLDTFRGFSLMIMIFVNYGGAGYPFFKHSVWNGLTLADMVFPWFTWMMGVSVVLSQRSLRAKNVRKASIFYKICRRTLILFVLGIMLQGGNDRWVNIRIFGVLQRLAVCYFITAIIVLIFDDTEDEPYSSEWPIGNDVHQRFRVELSNTLFHFWPQWLFVLLLTVAWILITFFVKFENCPSGYLGPGGKHHHGEKRNCTGGIAGYIDRLILGASHVFNHPTCKGVYETETPFDPEGILGILTGTLLCYLGVQAGHSFAHATRIVRVCAHWIISGLVCGGIGLALSKGGQSDSWIPINKNLWSLSFILVLASLAFFILTLLYLLVDVYSGFTGEPFLWLGMNSIVIYVGHEVCAKLFPVQFRVEETRHWQLMIMHLYGVIFWIIVAGVMYRKKTFIAI